METEYNYTCPSCSNECSVVASLVGQNVLCPACSTEFFATAPEQQDSTSLPIESQNHFVLPAKLPFFKSGRRKLLEQRLDELMITSAGELDQAAEDELNKNAIALGLDAGDGSNLLKERTLRDLEPIKRRMESSFVMTDEDVAEIDALRRRYNVKLTLAGEATLFREIFLLETTGKLPPPIETGLMLDEDELVYYTIATTWHQTRVHTRGYSGGSVSIPTGIKGVRFRFGGYTPVKTEDITPLSSGTLFVTSERLLFNGNTRNTSISLKKIIDGHMYADCVQVEKNTGKPDMFSMKVSEARYILSLIGVLKNFRIKQT